MNKTHKKIGSIPTINPIDFNYIQNKNAKDNIHFPIMRYAFASTD